MNVHSHPTLARLVLAGAVVLALAAPTLAQAAFVTFDSGQVRPLAMSPTARGSSR